MIDRKTNIITHALSFLDGMSREVFALTGGLPSIVAKAPPLAGLKDKRKLKDKKVSW